MRDTQQELVAILAGRLFLNEHEIQKINDKTSILSVCDDSLDLLDTVMALEDHFGINIPSPEKFRTIGELNKFIVGELND